MKVRFMLWLGMIRASYWFWPTLMLLGNGILALFLVYLDERVESENMPDAWWIFSGGAEGARAVLSTVAGSAIGVAGTTFSITIAVMSLTSSQFGSRLLRGFLRDRANQAVLGVFVSTFLYCLLVMRTIRSVDETVFIPHYAVTGGVVLAIICVAVLIFFIHHVSQSIQAVNIIANVASELRVAIDRIFPEEIGEEAPPPAEHPRISARPNVRDYVIHSEKSGYVQAIDGDALLAMAESSDLLIELNLQPGQFVVRGGELATIYGDERDDITALESRIRNGYTLGSDRTATQDSAFLLLQLVEIAVRALSPGVNDPFTAITCVDQIGAALSHLAERDMPSGTRTDEKGVVRIQCESPTFAAMLEMGFSEIYHYGRSDPMVFKRLHETLDTIEKAARTDERKNVVRQMKRILSPPKEKIKSE